MSIEISVAIPCYRSQSSVKELTKELTAAFEDFGTDYEIVYVNDASPDDTLPRLKEIADSYPNVKVVDLMYNCGQFKALMCALEVAQGKYIITMDDDLQHPPKEARRLYEFLKGNADYDVVLGKAKVKKHSLVRNLGSKMIGKIDEKIFDKPSDLHMSAFRCMRRNVVDTLIAHKTFTPVIGPLILKSTKKISNLEVENRPRKFGSSNYNMLRLVKMTFDNVLNFSSVPLKYISVLGFVICFLSIMTSVFFLIRYCIGGVNLPGWMTLIVLTNLYGGAILLAIGILGEYMIRVLSEVNQNPRFKIREIYEGR